MWKEPTIDDVAEVINQCLVDGDENSAIRIALRFVERFDASTWEVRKLMIQAEPRSTANARFDALLASVVEYSCAVRQFPAPKWVESPTRFLEEFWFVSGIGGLEADAFVASPISFARRGVFVNSGALEYA